MLYNSFDLSCFANSLDFPNILLVLVHILRLLSPPEWFEEYNIDYIVPSSACRNTNLTEVGSNSLYNLLRFKLFVYQELIVLRLHLQVSFVNQHLILNIEMSSFVHVKGSLFMIHVFHDITHIVVHSNYLVEAFFCGREGEFIVIIEVYGA